MNYVNIRTFLRNYAIVELPVVVTKFGKPIFLAIKPDELQPIEKRGNGGTKTSGVKKDGVL